jgi:hypothetical protein
VLLPVSLLARRADTVEVIGAALAARAAGAGHRVIAQRLGRSAVTVRGWLRRFGARVEVVRSFFTVLMVRVDIDPVVPAGSGSVWGGCDHGDHRGLAGPGPAFRRRHRDAVAERLRGERGRVAVAVLASGPAGFVINTT